MKTLLPLEPKKNLNSYLTQTFSFTECLRKKHTGHRFFLFCKKNTVFSNPHGSTILKIKNITVYISNIKKKEQSGTILYGVTGCSLYKNDSTVLLTHHQEDIIFFPSKYSRWLWTNPPHVLALDMAIGDNSVSGTKEKKNHFSLAGATLVIVILCPCLLLRYTNKINCGHE